MTLAPKRHRAAAGEWDTIEYFRRKLTALAEAEPPLADWIVHYVAGLAADMEAVSLRSEAGDALVHFALSCPSTHLYAGR